MTSLFTQGRDTEALIAELAQTPDPRLREAVIERHAPLVRSLARKFERPGVPAEDLEQTAWIALIRALDRFDPAHETQFSTYAVHCMVGEIKRYFRDRTWCMKVPRQLQEIAVQLPRVQDGLRRRLGREPSMSEMAEACGIDGERLAEAMELQQNYSPTRLEDRSGPREEGDGLAVGETLGSEDPELHSLVENAPLYAAIAGLEDRDRLILRRRFYDGFTQQEVASELGLSQMHVSRLERTALRRLRETMNSGDLVAA
jgi:RNA polymerase sigma-B factor